MSDEEVENNPELHPLKEALQRARLRLEEATGIRCGQTARSELTRAWLSAAPWMAGCQAGWQAQPRNTLLLSGRVGACSHEGGSQSCAAPPGPAP